MSNENVSGFFSRASERESKDVLLPSGRKITVLETTGREEKIISRVGEKRDFSFINKFLAGVTANLDGKDGPIGDKDFDNMLSGDRTFILLQTRLLTHGSIVNYHMTCSGCNTKSEHEIDLQSVVEEMVPYSNGDTREISIKIGDGELWFELPTGATEAKIAKFESPDINTKFVAMKLWEVTEKGKIPVRIEDLKSKYIAELRKAVRAAECQLDTVVTLVCPGCRTHHRADVVSNTDFLFPGSM